MENLRNKFKVGDEVNYLLNKKGCAKGVIKSIRSFRKDTPYEDIILVITDNTGGFDKEVNMGQIISNNI